MPPAMLGSPPRQGVEAGVDAGGDVGNDVGSAASAITLEHVTVRYSKVQNAKQVAVRDVSLSFPRNQVTALLGPSGCGKTTILRAINRMHDHTSGKVTGSIRVGDLDVYARDTQPEIVRSRVGMVFQRPNLFPTLSIFDNVVAGLRMNGVRKPRLPARGGRGGAPPGRPVGLGQGPPRAPGGSPLGGATATSLHRAGPRHRARSTPPRRALLGARPASLGPKLRS